LEQKVSAPGEEIRRRVDRELTPELCEQLNDVIVTDAALGEGRGQIHRHLRAPEISAR
jgi:hypothetical protein